MGRQSPTLLSWQNLLGAQPQSQIEFLLPRTFLMARQKAPSSTVRGAIFGLLEAAVQILSRSNRALVIYHLLPEPEGLQTYPGSETTAYCL